MRWHCTGPFEAVGEALRAPILTAVRAAILLILLPLSGMASADSWRYPAERTERVFDFGATRIVLVTDGTKDRKYPDFTMQIFHGQELKAIVPHVSFEHIAGSPDGRLFVGLSNRGLPDSAMMLFDLDGAIRLHAIHDVAAFDYCEKSVTLARVWYDGENPDVKFLPPSPERRGPGITVRDCRGKTVNRVDVVLKAYHTTYMATQAERMRRVKGKRE
ncbi:hypothetical protein [Pseudoduganella sp.]|uniref:hypothetical protein n=1 Tax=Pseudoduganella sp. TaxID=1880898 RepID=UPI0035AF534F